jgi:hypothetical protein
MTMIFSLVLKIKADGQLEVELHSSALMGTLEGIEDFNINLWSVECSVSGVLLPRLSESV